MSKINNELSNQSVPKIKTTRYKVKGFSPIINILIFIILLIGFLKFPLSVTIIAGLYTAELIAFKLTNEPRLTLVETTINIVSKYDINANVNIFMSDKSSLFIRSNDDGNLVNIYLKESKSKFGLVILSEAIQVYHLYVYLNLAKMACDNNYTHTDALESIGINKTVSFFRTIKYIPNLYKTPILEI